ncbi:MAG: hypothetical protein PHE26_05505, partial [Syntrophomonadaceae bacterium]|nr:hypothetical protein [Syntrophomonadaceae bacterium]
PSGPYITGTDTINLTEGYASIDRAYTFGGYPAPTYGISPTEPNTANATFAGTTLTIPGGLTEAGSPYFVTLTASNSEGTVTKTITVNVSPAETLPTITGPDTINLTEGYASIDQAYTFGGNPAPTHSISDTEPNTANATLTGNMLAIPEGLTAADSPYSVTLFATNSAGTVSKTITVNVSPAETLPTITGPDTINLLQGFVSIEQEYTFDGNSEPPTCSSTPELDPEKVTLTGNTLTILGDGLDSGSYEVTLTAFNSAGTTTKTVTVNVFYIDEQIEFFLSEAVNKINASGGKGVPFTFTLASGSMPDGLTLNDDGTITGTASTGEHDPVSVMISDGAGNSITITMPVHVYE